ncbi:MAG: hypothetical protein JO027_12950, partial [Solirubrobacterales bacterium]|nr:hypothetical protein [Solirubrobacterales bacterium]
MKLDDQLQRRLGEGGARARELLGWPDAPTADLAALRELIAALRDQMPTALPGEEVEEQEGALGRLRQRFGARFEALELVQRAVGELREVTSPREMLARAPAALCRQSRFARAIVSVVRSGRMIAEAVWFAGDGGGREAARVLAQLQANPVR